MLVILVMVSLLIKQLNYFHTEGSVPATVSTHSTNDAHSHTSAGCVYSSSDRLKKKKKKNQSGTHTEGSPNTKGAALSASCCAEVELCCAEIPPSDQWVWYPSAGLEVFLNWWVGTPKRAVLIGLQLCRHFSPAFFFLLDMIESWLVFLFLWKTFGLWLHDQGQQCGSWDSTRWEPLV